MKVGLATSEKFPELWSDDQLLQAALVRRGIDARPVVWNDPGVDWSSFSLVVVRSMWDYHRHYPEFLRWVDGLPKELVLLNDRTTVRWNSHKGYLRDLARRGIPTVPTLWGSELASVTEALRDRAWPVAVLKPAVGANAEGAVVVRSEDPSAAESSFLELRRAGEVLVQPYVRAVDGPGERSLVVLDGRFSHAVLRTSRLAAGSALRDGDPLTPAPQELELAERVVAGIDPRPLYARVDLVPGEANGPSLMELELIEPLLYLSTRPGSADELAETIVARLSTAPTRSEATPSSGER